MKNISSIFQGYADFIGNRSSGDALGMLLGRPENELPYKKEIIEQVLEIYVLESNIEYLKVKSKVAEDWKNSIECLYLILAEYVSQNDVQVQTIGINKSLSEKIVELVGNSIDVEKISAVVTHNMEKYMQKINELRVLSYESIRS